MRIPAAGSVAQETQEEGKDTEVVVFRWSPAHGGGTWSRLSLVAWMAE